MYYEARKSPHAADSWAGTINFFYRLKGVLMTTSLFFECLRREAVLEYQREVRVKELCFFLANPLRTFNWMESWARVPSNVLSTGYEGAAQLLNSKAWKIFWFLNWKDFQKSDKD